MRKRLQPLLDLKAVSPSTQLRRHCTTSCNKSTCSMSGPKNFTVEEARRKITELFDGPKAMAQSGSLAPIGCASETWDDPVWETVKQQRRRFTHTASLQPQNVESGESSGPTHTGRAVGTATDVAVSCRLGSGNYGMIDSFTLSQNGYGHNTQH